MERKLATLCLARTKDKTRLWSFQQRHYVFFKNSSAYTSCVALAFPHLFLKSESLMCSSLCWLRGSLFQRCSTFKTVDIQINMNSVRVARRFAVLGCKMYSRNVELPEPQVPLRLYEDSMNRCKKLEEETKTLYKEKEAEMKTLYKEKEAEMKTLYKEKEAEMKMLYKEKEAEMKMLYKEKEVVKEKLCDRKLILNNMETALAELNRDYLLATSGLSGRSLAEQFETKYRILKKDGERLAKWKDFVNCKYWKSENVQEKIKAVGLLTKNIPEIAYELYATLSLDAHNCFSPKRNNVVIFRKYLSEDCQKLLKLLCLLYPIPASSIIEVDDINDVTDHPVLQIVKKSGLVSQGHLMSMRTC